MISNPAQIVLVSIVIDAQPQDLLGAVGDPVSFSVTARGTDLTYQWQVSTNGGSSKRKKTAYDKVSGLIYNQTNFENSNESVGLGTFAQNGCAVIATYNVMQLLGKNESLGSVRNEYLYQHGAIAGGLGGVGPWRFDDYFANHGISCTGYAFFSQLHANVSDGDIVIFTVMNDVDDITAGFHTMAAQYVNGAYQVYNAYSNSVSYSTLSNLRKVYTNSMWIYGYIVGG